jgi:hypothetical protein
MLRELVFTRFVMLFVTVIGDALSQDKGQAPRFPATGGGMKRLMSFRWHMKVPGMKDIMIAG